MLDDTDERNMECHLPAIVIIAINVEDLFALDTGNATEDKYFQLP